jgi:hypothetical protein
LPVLCSTPKEQANQDQVNQQLLAFFKRSKQAAA